jgi:uncharacterized protein (DUF885 family)
MRSSTTSLALALVLLPAGCGKPAAAPPTASAAPVRAAGEHRPAWAIRSDEAIGPYIDLIRKESPEWATTLGFEDSDENISDAAPGFRDRARADHLAVKAELERRRAAETDRLVAEDLAISLQRVDLDLRSAETDEKYMLPVQDVARHIFGGLRTLLEDRVTPERRAKALTRLRKYVGLEPGTKPLTELAMQDCREHLARAGLVPPSRAEVEKQLSTSATLRDGIGKLFAKYGIAGADEPIRALATQLDAYDKFVRENVLPVARTTFVLPEPVYAMELEEAGVKASPDELIQTGHREFDAIQGEMKAVAVEVAKAHGFPSSDYRDVIRELKKTQVGPDAIVALYTKRLGEIEDIVRREKLITLPTHAPRIRVASVAESAQSPAPHMSGARIFGNTGETGEFILPLGIPGGTGTTGTNQTFDDFTYDAVAWTLIAHELRPGHELQFDAMIDRGVSFARAVIAENSANVEGWGLYSEVFMYPFMPADGKLASLQLRLQRAARMFVDPELQRGKWTFETARDFLQKEVALSSAFATSEVERYTFKSPGQATAYMYGLLKMQALRAEIEKSLGPKFDAQDFHDAVIEQGTLPPDLLREAVLAKLGIKG